jgi:AAA family ATP:ADP antiporter
VVSLLFWQFCNTIVRSGEAKRFYSHFGLLGNISLPMVAVVFWIFLSEDSNYMPKHLQMMPVLIIVICMDCVFLCIYTWIQNNVMTDPKLCDQEKPEAKTDTKKKAKLSMADSFKMIFTSK